MSRLSKYSIWLFVILLSGAPLAALAFVAPSLNYAVENNVGSGYDAAQAVATDGTYVYLAARDQVPGNDQWRVEKRNLSDGSLVYATTTNPTGSNTEYPDAIVIDDTYMYIAGHDQTGGNVGWRIEKRLLSDGGLIYATTSNPSSGNEYLEGGVAINSSSIFLAGTDRSAGNLDWRFEKRNLSDGSLVYVVTSSPSVATDGLWGMMIDDSYAYMVGRENSGTSAAGRLEKRNLSDGSLVYATTSNPSAGFDSFNDIALDEDGYLYIVGEDNTPGGSDWASRLEKRNTSDGSLVYATSTNIGAGSEDFYWAVSLSEDHIYAGGYLYSADYATNTTTFAAYTISDGSLLFSTSYNSSGYYAGMLDMSISDTTLLAVSDYCPLNTSNCSIYFQSYNLAPIPTVSSYSPTSLVSGSGINTLTLSGTNFSASTTRVSFNGKTRDAVYVSSTQMTLELPASETQSAGTFTLTIPNDNSLGTSGSSTYTITQGEDTSSSGSGGRSSGSKKQKEPKEEEQPAETPASTPTFQFLVNLKQGMTHSDVKELQKFLNQKGFIVSDSGLGSSGNETEFFGAKTKAALIKFQEANAEQILKPNNLTKGTGYFGPSTRAAVNGMR